ncbi:MAG: lytic transglycosylase domain-containing protein [Gammaproteobacteria bacterium]|nr:lytic transglycosylase domain-containing protein [Gammaproteobacteria bacterium]MCP5424282.1 lytic transglycosylase domain-containing protein [Gammaproteobacteria bacterium]MCP5459035.1 lytic transglycosylase domain-containing protein [Gammaproteobacteria bacterium]
MSSIMPLPGKKRMMANTGLLIVSLLLPIAESYAEPYRDQVVAPVELDLAAAENHSQDAKIQKLSRHIQRNYQVRSNKADLIVAEAYKTGTRYDVEPELILSIIAVESTFRERAIGPQGARGLMQVLPRSHPGKIREIGGARALFDPGKNIHTGTRILADYLGDSRNLRSALARYNGSYRIHWRYADKVLRVYNRFKQVTRSTRTTYRTMPASFSEAPATSMASTTDDDSTFH